TLASGDQITTISSLAYRLASTLGIVTDTQLTARVRQARPMYFVGLDLAGGEKKQPGVAAVDSDGRLLHVGIAQDDASIIDAVGPFTGDDCLVAIDAPLIVNNAGGYRPAEAQLNRHFLIFLPGSYSAD